MIRRSSPGRFNGTQASRGSTSALGCRRPTGMFMASVVSRTNCTSEPRRQRCAGDSGTPPPNSTKPMRSEEHTSELQSPCNLVCRLLLEKKKKNTKHTNKHNSTKVKIDSMLL